MNRHVTSRLYHLILGLIILAGLTRTKAGVAQTWQPVFELGSGRVSGLAADAPGNVFAATDSGVFLSTDDGKHWGAASNGLFPKQVFAVTICSSGTLLASTEGGIFRSTDTGHNWAVTKGLTENTHVDCFAWDRTGHYYAGDMSLGVFYSSDDGVSWNQRNNGLPHKGVWSLAAAMNGDIYAGINGYIARSTNLGERWDTTESLSSFDRVTALGCDSMHNIFAGTKLGRFLRGFDGGDSWQEIIPGPISIAFNCMAVRSDSIFAGSADHGMLLSYDDGFHWGFYNLGIPDSSSVMLSVTSTESGLTYAGTLNGRIMRIGDLPIRSVKGGLNISSEFDLTAQSVGVGARLRLVLPEAQAVAITIYNLLGVKMLELGARPFEAGESIIPLDGKAVRCGSFIATAICGDGMRVTKIILVE